MTSTMKLAIDKAQEEFRRLPDIIFCSFNVANDPNYAYFKSEGTQLGYPTQALQAKHFGRKLTSVQLIVK